MNEVPLPLWAEVLIAALVLGGATIALLGSLGLLRLKSYFERVHAPSIIATMGCWLIMWATFVFFTATGQGLALHALLIAVFIAVTVPITTIFLMRAALFRARRAGRDVPPSVSRIVPNEPQHEAPKETPKN
ncbi:monovalent cation/H(+) antiporter subunit G [Comamonas aquatica]|uniref:monovalent cation/H(+) antiporter subunit G n=1 Tax=Comamonas aquatica TaxID=225991 RepID=UPI00244C0DAB|nr:monovalent cation/H(+) antiporter subunit G [Comamonas aquatica]MDH0372967.1 monovalent cation/H(+) antiporter subunit G [Comamonas aquatica]MDH0383062.1 monovalent cation/H(+) antiporter subunit G [Comamonas aquatica]MDH0431066.1 monovalent cation/H(+) antiporter subunit G [Comamonas aquatica]MDH0942440.1 monovalent cation/H(+) antiporter subunit G [Comamonas aquatica]